MTDIQQAVAALESLYQRYEQLLATLAIQSAALRDCKPEPVRVSPKRLTTAQACEQLQCSRTTLESCAARGLLTQPRPKGKGRGKPVYYVPEEIAALAVSELEAAETVERRKRRRWR